MFCQKPGGRDGGRGERVLDFAKKSLKRDKESMEEKEAEDSTFPNSTFVRPGEILLESKPFVAVLVGDAVRTHCHGCFMPLPPNSDPPFITCGRCLLPRYCHPDCVDEDSRCHARECRSLSGEGEAEEEVRGSNILRILARLLLKLRSGGGEVTEEVPSGRKGKTRRGFWDLMSHECEYRSSERLFKWITWLHWSLSRLLGPSVAGSLDWFVGVYGRLMINSFEVCGDQRSGPKAWGLYLSASVMDHSCSPNASVSFRGSGIVVRALTEIPKEGGEVDLANRVSISYIDPMEHSTLRRRELLKRYYFMCQCSRCCGGTGGGRRRGTKEEKIEEDLSLSKLEKEAERIFHSCYGHLLCPSGRHPTLEAEDLLYSVRCDSCTGRPVYVGPPSALEQEPECGRCGAEVGEEALEEYVEVYQKVQEALCDGDEHDGMADDGHSTVTAEVPSRCLRLMQSALFHPQHRLFVRACEFAFEDACAAAMTLSRSASTSATEYGQMCVNAYRRYGGHCWKNVGLYEHKLGAVMVQRTKEEPYLKEDALEHLSCALAVLTRTNGREGQITRKTRDMLERLRLEVDRGEVVEE